MVAQPRFPILNEAPAAASLLHYLLWDMDPQPRFPILKGSGRCAAAEARERQPDEGPRRERGPGELRRGAGPRQPRADTQGHAHRAPLRMLPCPSTRPRPPRLSAVMNTVKRHPFPHQACSLCRDLHFKGFSEPCHVPSCDPPRYIIFCSMGILQVPCCKGRVPCSHAAKCRIDPRPAAQLDKCSN